MTLNELMDVMNENQTVEIYDRNDDSIAKYDGRDSIPAVFNADGSPDLDTAWATGGTANP
jgi:hypothetical protein